MNEEQIRKKVRDLRAFYMDLTNYLFVNFILILIWFIFDRGDNFWPKYVIIIWGIILLIRAYRRNLVPLWACHCSFMTKDWEDKKVGEILKRKPKQNKIKLKKK